MIPWSIKLSVRKEIRNGIRSPANFEEECIEIWQESWTDPSAGSRGARIKKLIPDIGKWYHREHGELTYELTQFITGHGAFREYLKRIGKRQSGACNLCDSGEGDNADRAIFHCRYFNTARERWKQLTDNRITEDNIIDEMIESPDCWKACGEFIKLAVSTKEALDRIEERVQLTEQEVQGTARSADGDHEEEMTVD
jgi:hypothetical protein